jgi:MFS family permease
VGLLFALTWYGFYVQALGGLAAPFLAQDLGLDESQITALAGWIAIGAFGTAALTRLADRRGRRRILLLCFAGLPPLALASAFATSRISYVVPQIAANALLGGLLTALAVAVAEVSLDTSRARDQGRFGFWAAMGGAVALGVGAAVPWLPGGWRAFWGVAALPLVALPFVRARLVETERFRSAHADGRVATARIGDLLRGAYRRRALGLWTIALLRPVALTATQTWPYYHMVKTLALSPASASLVYFVGGGVGLAGNYLGARWTDTWGRRPTSLVGSLVAILSGVAFFFIPLSSGPMLVPTLIAVMAVNQVTTSVFSVADRCIDAELFPTALRATYLGVARLMMAAAGVTAMFGLSVLATPLGSLANAIALLSLATMAPAIVLFLLVVPETRGMSLEQASLERDPAS